MAGAQPDPSLHESLLHGAPAPSDRRPESRWAYPLWGLLLVSVFVLFHSSVLLVWNTPSKGLAKPFHRTFLKTIQGYEYFRGTRNSQSWGMFAPNPTRTNTFVRVFVEDQDGVLWDFEQDIWGEDRYPYAWYDRRGKVNRRIDNKKKYQRIYGAWVCRQWERTHDGESPKSVSFVKRWTRVPHPNTVIKAGGWDQWDEDHFKQKQQETITCKTAVHGTLPNELRKRYGLDLIDEDEDFRDVSSRTWWDKQERKRKAAEKKAKREAAQAARLEQRSSKRRQPTQLDARGPLRSKAVED